MHFLIQYLCLYFFAETLSLHFFQDDLGNHDTKTTSNTVLESTEENADNEGDKKLWDDDDNMPPNTYNDDLIQDLSNKVNDPAYIQEP